MSNNTTNTVNNTQKGLKGLFSFPNKSPQPASPSIAVPQTQNLNPDEIATGETYVHYGTRICGKVAGSITVLDTFLQKVLQYEYNAQSKDTQLQQQMRNTINSEIINIQTQINQENNNEEAQKNQLQALNDSMLQKQQEKEAKVANAKEGNKEAILKRNIGLIILIPLTLYLFTFYSSTFYSAFFLNAEEAVNTLANGLMGAMFNARAIPQAWQDGIMELIFVVSAPIIFLGLGFSLHIFSTQKGWTKYFKMAAIVLVTFIFDCILAGKIAKMFYDISAMNSLTPMPPFTLEMAIHDLNFWMVIFSGFVVYIIWGLVFSFTWSAHVEINTNASAIKEIDLQIQHIGDQQSAINSNITAIRNKILQLQGDLQQKQNSLSSKVQIDLGRIKAVLADFFSGWMVGMSMLGCSPDQQGQAQGIYNNYVANLN